MEAFLLESDVPERVELKLQRVVNTPYCSDRFQDRIYLAELVRAFRDNEWHDLIEGEGREGE